MNTKTQRFPAALLTYARNHLAHTLSPRTRERLEGEGHARNHGELRAMIWILQSYGEPTGGLMDDTQGIAGVPFDRTPLVRTKREFASMVDQMISKFEAAHSFTTKTGWAQVDCMGSEINEAYGFYDALNTLMETLDLWTVAVQARDQ